MFRVYKRPCSSFYWADISVPNPDGGDPLRIRKSTKKKTKKAAQEAAAIMADAERRKAAADDDTSDAVLASVQEAVRLHAQGRLTLEKGRALVAEMAAASAGGELEFKTIRDWFTEWLEGRKAVVKQGTHDQYRSHIGFLLDWLGDDADKRLEWLTRAKLTQFRDAVRDGFRGFNKSGKPKKETPRRRRTVDEILKHVRGALQVAVRDGMILGNPADAVEPLGTEDSETREPFNLKEVEALFAAAPSTEWRALMHVAFYGGLRLMDGARLRWKNVDLLANEISFKPRKTSRKGKTLTIPIHPKLQAQLEALPSADNPEAFVLPELATKERQKLNHEFKAVMAAAGIGQMEATTGKLRKFNRRSYHSWRHSLVSALANKDVPQELRMKLVGQSTVAVHATYTHTELETLANALGKLP